MGCTFEYSFEATGRIVERGARALLSGRIASESWILYPVGGGDSL